MNELGPKTPISDTQNSVSDTALTTPTPGYLTLSQASVQTPYSQEYISLLVRKGRLPGKKFGRNWHIKQEDLDAYVAEQAQKASEKVDTLASSTPEPIVKTAQNPVNLANISQIPVKRPFLPLSVRQIALIVGLSMALSAPIFANLSGLQDQVDGLKTQFASVSVQNPPVQKVEFGEEYIKNLVNATFNQLIAPIQQQLTAAPGRTDAVGESREQSGESRGTTYQPGLVLGLTEDLQLIATIKTVLSDPSIQEQFRGPQGPAAQYIPNSGSVFGTTAPTAPQGHQGTIGSATYLSTKEFHTETIKASGDITQTGGSTTLKETTIDGNLTVTGIITPSTGDFSIAGHLLPTTDNTFNLGSATKRWKDLFISGNSLFDGNVGIGGTSTFDGGAEFNSIAAFNDATEFNSTGTFANTLTAEDNFELLGGSLNLTATSGELNLTGLSGITFNTGLNNTLITSANFNTTATGINATVIGATTAAAATFTSLTSTSLAELNSLEVDGNVGIGGNINQSGNTTFTTGTGLATISGNLNVNGVTSNFASSSLNLTAANPVLDLTHASTLGINTVTNRPVTFGSGLVTIPNLSVTNSQSNNGTMVIDSAATTATIFEVIGNSLTSGTAIKKTVTANAGNGQTTTGERVNLVDSTTGSGGYVGIGVSVSGSGVGSGAKYLLDLDAGANKQVVFDNAGAFRPTTSVASNTNTIGSPSFYWKNGYFDQITANNIAGTVVTGATSSTTWTIGSTEAGDVNEAIIFQRNLGSGNATIQWNAGAGDLRYLSVNYPFNSTYTVDDASIGTGINLYSGALTNNTTSGTQKLLSLTNTGTGTTETGIYLNNTGTGTTALEIAGTWANGIVTNNNSINTGTGTITSGLINGQTISSSANFTGSATVASGFTVSAGAVSLPAGVIDNAELANSSLTYTAGTGLTGGGLVSLGGSATFNIGAGTCITSNADDIAVTADCISDTQLAFNTGQHLTTSSTPTFAGLTLNGALAMGSNTITSGLINGQTISSSANFTGTMNIAGNVGIGTSTPGILIGGHNLTSYRAVQIRSANRSYLQLSGQQSVIQLENTDGTAGSRVFQAYWSGDKLITHIQSEVDGSVVSNPLTLQSNGNVGIGTSNPGSVFHVYGSAQTLTNLQSTDTQVYQRFSNASDSSVYVGNNAGTYLVQTNATTRLSILNSGNVGIGTTNPSYKLSIEESKTITPTSGDGQLWIENSSATTTNAAAILLSSQGTRRAQITGGRGAAGNDGYLAFTTRQNSDGLFYERMRINEAGNVGIGSTAPQNIFVVSSGVNGDRARFVNTNAGAGTSTITLEQTAANTYNWALVTNYDTLGDFALRKSTASLGDPYSTGSTMFVVKNSGSVGIGTSGPQATLDVQASTASLNLKSTSAGVDLKNVRLRNAGGLFHIDSVNDAFDTVTPRITTNLNTGAVGIGDSNPSYKLQVTAGATDGFSVSNSAGVVTARFINSSANPVITRYTNNSGNFFDLQNNTNNSFTLDYNDTEILRATSLGNVGIGTTPPSGNRLVIKGAGSASDSYALNISNSSDATTFVVDNSGNVGIGELTPASKLSVSGGATIGALYDTTAAPTNGLAVQGNVGIGTTNPSANLDVYGSAATARVTGTSSSIPSLELSSAGVVNWNLRSNFNGSSGFEIRQDSNNRLTILSGGNVGIGTTNPTQKLEVQGGYLKVCDAPGCADTSKAFVQGNVSVAYFGALSTQRASFGNSENFETLTVDGGNVGIGTTNPVSKLEVTGAIGSRVSSNFVALEAATDGYLSWGPSASSRNLIFGTASTYPNSGFSEKMRITETGNVGIGTTTINDRLQVYQNTAGFAGIRIANDGTVGSTTRSGVRFGEDSGTDYAEISWFRNGADEFRIWNKVATGDITFRVNSGEAMQIRQDGNVGIGTTNPTNNLHVYGATGVGLRLTRGNVGTWDFGITGVDGDNTMSIEPVQATSGLTLRARNSANNLFDAVVIRANGNVGIGTTIPSSKLHININDGDNLRLGNWEGALELQPTNDGANVGLIFGGLTTARAGAVLWGTSASGNDGTTKAGQIYGELSSSTNFNMRFYTNNAVGTQAATEKLTILGSGNVGIGSSNPGNKLTVVPSSDSGVVVREADDGADAIALKSNNTRGILEGRSAGTQTLQISAGTENSYLNGGGNVGIGTNNPQAFLHVLKATTGYPVARLTQDGASEYTLLQIQNTNSTAANVVIGTGGGSVANTAFANKAVFGTTSGAALSLITSDTERLSILSGGNVGIGTASPATKLDVFDNTAIQATFRGYATIGSGDSRNGAIALGQTAAFRGLLQYDVTGNTVLSFDNTYDSASAAMQFRMRTAGTPVTAMTILGSGNIGIGSTNPANTLVLDRASGNNLLQFNTNGTTIAHVGVSSTVDNPITGMTAGDLGLRVQGNDLFVSTDSGGSGSFVVKNGGNVGIGTIAPNTKLEVAGQIQTSVASGVSYSAGNYLVHSDEEEYSIVDDSSDSNYKLMKSWTVDKTGSVRVTFAAYIQSGSFWFGYKIAKNGGTTLNLTSGTAASGHYNSGLASGETTSVHAYRKFSMDVAGLTPGDTLELWMVSSNSGGVATAGNGQILYAKEFRVHSSSPEYGSASDSISSNNNIAIRESSTTGSGPSINFQRSKAGSLTAPTAVLSGDVLGSVNFQGLSAAFANNTAASYGPYGTSARLQSVVTENFSSTARGTALTFATTANTTTTLSERMRIDQSGFVGIGTTTPSQLLSVGTDNQGGVSKNVRVASYHSFGGAYIGQGPNTGEMGLSVNTYGRTATGDYNTLDFTSGAAWSLMMRGYDGGNSGGYFKIRSAAATAGTPSFTDHLTILPSGNVGIGTTSPNFTALGVDHTVVTIGGAASTPMGALELSGTRTTNGDLGRVVFANQGTRRAEVYASRIDEDTSAKLSFATSNAGSLGIRMTIAKDGNVGIGTTNPGSYILNLQSTTAQMNVQSTTGTNYAFTQYSNGSGNTIIGTERSTTGGLFGTGTLAYASVFGSSANTATQFATNNIVRMTIDTSGNVGIGTTVPDGKFHVVGSNSYFTNSSGAQSLRLQSSDRDFSTDIGLFQDEGGSRTYGAYFIVDAATSDLRLVKRTNNSDANVITVLNSNGNVGIGTTGPGSKLDISSGTTDTGGLRVTGSTGYSALYTDGGQDSRLDTLGTNNDGLYVNYSSPKIFSVNNSYLYVSTSGNVGIGTTNPAQILNLNGASRDIATLYTVSNIALSSSVGFTAPSTLANDASVGSGAWSNPTNAAISDNSYATYTAGSSTTTNYLKGTNYGFSVPGGATIVGIEVEVEKKKAASSGSQDLNSGSGNWSVPAGVSTVTVTMNGGGGGGYGGGGGNGAGGGGGAIVSYNLPVTPGGTVAYSVGTGGSGASAPPTAGTATTFGILTANGGNAGGANGGGQGGSATNGSVTGSAGVANGGNGGSVAAGGGTLYGGGGGGQGNPAGQSGGSSFAGGGSGGSCAGVPTGGGGGSYGAGGSVCGGNGTNGGGGAGQYPGLPGGNGGAGKISLSWTTSAVDNRVSIVKADGSIGSTNKASVSQWSTSDTVVTYGGPSDLWGETWTSADINDSDFGFVISAIASNTTVSVDLVRVKVYYGGTTAANWTVGSQYSQSGDFKISNSTALGTTDRLSINSSGFIGIGTNTPSVALDINGDIEYTGTITDVSDMRLKENIRDFEDALSIVTSIGVKSYNMIGSSTNEVGFIAQNVKEYFPNAVSTVDPVKGYLGVSYVSFIPVLTKAVQQLDSQTSQSFVSDTAMNVGDLAILVNGKVRKATGASGESVIGVVSQSMLDQVTVRLTGNYKVRVSAESGAVQAGQRLAASQTRAGYATRLTGSGQSVGVALADAQFNNEGFALVDAFIDIGYQSMNLTQDSGGQIVAAGQSQDWNMNGFAIRNISALTSLSGKWGFDQVGNLVALGHIEVGVDTAGSAIILAGTTSVEVSFETAYTNVPKVVVSALGDAGTYWVGEKTTNGFKIFLKSALSSDMEFDWHSLVITPPTPIAPVAEPEEGEGQAPEEVVESPDSPDDDPSEVIEEPEPELGDVPEPESDPEPEADPGSEPGQNP